MAACSDQEFGTEPAPPNDEQSKILVEQNHMQKNLNLIGFHFQDLLALS